MSSSPAESEDLPYDAQQRQLQRLLSERHLLSNEIHDGLIQYLIGAKMFLESAMAQLDESLDEQAKQAALGPLVEAAKSLDQALVEARQLMSEQRWQLADLIGAVRTELDKRLPAAAMTFELNVAGAEFAASVAPEINWAAWRIAQESLSNVIRHSGAKCVRVGLAFDDAGFEMTIADDGIGLAKTGADVGNLADSTSAEFHGIQGMRERTEFFGGQFKIESGTDGTEVCIRLPFGG